MINTIARVARRYGRNLTYIFAPSVAASRQEPVRLPLDTNLKRRAVLAGLPATGAAIALPDQVKAQGESPLRALYFEWQTAKDEFRDLPFDCEPCLEDRAWDKIVSVEEQAAAFEPGTTEDLLFKIIFADDNGDMDVNIYQQILTKRAYDMVGIEPRVRSRR